ncbi:hypothetical protein KO498_07410 [Lentibacter algarum]|uniref:hypothetical protein n=1 Tax=Lentibacter algarum TaxID=576131 RepID=UPI001C072809|nr:hypothetical protein [Lentibacter algarum]MBU2981642.1 hypothetical protein [Lentibacter algarum]
MNKIFGWLLSGLFFLSSLQTTLACAFHGYNPNPTLVDVLLTTEQAVIARLDPANSQRYKVTEVLMGSEAPDIPVPVAANIRKTLAASPTNSILLARDGAYGPWMALTILDSRLQSVIKQVVHKQSAFNNGTGEARLAMFAKLVNDQSPAVRRLALQELDRAPYNALQRARLPKVQGLKQQLETGDEALMPIRVLLAGLTESQSFSGFMRDELDLAIKGDIAYMGAYATALVELEGKPAVEHLLQSHLSNKALPLTTRTKLLQALSIQHKTAPRATRRAIAQGVANLLHTSPELSESAAQFFGFRKG